MYFFLSFFWLIHSWLIERIENNHRHTFWWSCDRCYWESNATVLSFRKHREFDKSNGNNWRTWPNQCERRHLQVSFLFSYFFLFIINETESLIVWSVCAYLSFESMRAHLFVIGINGNAIMEIVSDNNWDESKKWKKKKWEKSRKRKTGQIKWTWI